MPPRSTAKFVSYDLRPSKQIERKMMLDSFGAALESGFPISEYRYVGMGGNRFYDFMLVHKFLGIEQMTSLEHDPKMMPRALYNLPYQFIEVVNLDVQGFISKDTFSGNTIYWMDYDDSINPNITRDITSLAPRIKLRDFVFFTVCGAPPKRFRNQSSADRLVEFKEMFGELAQTASREDMENISFTTAVHKVLDAAFTNAFVVRSDGEFSPFFQVRYKDGVEMLTFGGMFALGQQCKQFAKVLKNKVPFLRTAKLKSYEIKKFDLTDRERVLFDRAATAKQANAKELDSLKQLGFGKEELDRYQELLRYHPRYVEALI